jgi:hypothetical protein
MLRVSDRIRLSISQPTEWERSGNQIDAAMVLAGADFVSVGETPLARHRKTESRFGILVQGSRRLGHELGKADS